MGEALQHDRGLPSSPFQKDLTVLGSISLLYFFFLFIFILLLLKKLPDILNTFKNACPPL